NRSQIRLGVEIFLCQWECENETTQTIEEKEMRIGMRHFLPPVLKHMKNNSTDSALQARFNDLISQFTQASPLGSLLSPADLQAFLQTGLSQLLQSALETERSLHLNEQTGDRANGYAPKRSLHLGTTQVQMEDRKS